MREDFDFVRTSRPVFASELSLNKPVLFSASKRAFDIAMSLALLPLLLIMSVAIFMLNPFYSRGPLFFVQRRMGQNCQPFWAIKFRTMTESAMSTRSANCPLETDRITPLGHILRKTRIDELPQIINVLRGEMSLIGPRPDAYDHAMVFLETVPGYRDRHVVRPGISGLAQTERGYIEGVDGTRKKVRTDLYYIAHTNFFMESWIVWRTISVILRKEGS